MSRVNRNHLWQDLAGKFLSHLKMHVISCHVECYQEIVKEEDTKKEEKMWYKIKDRNWDSTEGPKHYRRNENVTRKVARIGTSHAGSPCLSEAVMHSRE